MLPRFGFWFGRWCTIPLIDGHCRPALIVHWGFLTMTRVLAAGLFLWCGFVGSGGGAFGQATSGSAQIVEDARRDYYNLGREGVKEFRCDVKAPWDWFTARSSADAAARDRMHAALEQVHFDATVGA